MEKQLIARMGGILVAFMLIAGCAGVTRMPNINSQSISKSALDHVLDLSKEKDNPECVYQVSSHKFSSSDIDSDLASLGGRIEDRSLAYGTLHDLSSTDHLRKIDQDPVKSSPTLWNRLSADQSNFYSRESMLSLGLVFAAGAAVANTDADSQLQRHFQASVRGATSREWSDYFHANKELGNGVYTIPIMGAAWLANEYIDGPPAFEGIGLWGERSVRGFALGAPSLIVAQRLTGGSRPYENESGSQWHPFRDNNGVSGHAFMSSLPLITAAKMTDNPWQKSLLYLGSTIGPLSRVNDNAHYPSQIGMGWAMAFLAASAVQQTDTGKRGWSLLSHSPTYDAGFSMQYRW